LQHSESSGVAVQKGDNGTDEGHVNGITPYNISRNPEDRRPPAISSGSDDDLNDFAF
jgi:hypothetical protein